MKTEQFQKGNYVHIQLAGALEICQVIGVHDQVTVASINDPFENLQFDLADLQPIPLTEFWLKELSFDEVKDGSAADSAKTFERNGIVVTCQKTDGEKSVIRVGQHGQEVLETIQSVHQLQNFYMAAKSELINLP